MRAKWIGLIGVGVGAAVALLGRDQWEAWAKSRECCSSKRPATAQTCPLHHGDDGKLAATDQAEMDRLRRAMRDGVFVPWVELGRAPTPDEIGQRLHLDAAGVDKLMDTLEGCGESFEVGIRRVPDSDLIAIAWPFSNVPTGITVTVDGGKPAQARCAVDSLGVSKMMGRKATIDGQMRDTGALLHVVVDGDKLVSADPASAIVFKGAGCDQMLFFSSQEGLDAWKKQHAVEGGKVFAMNEAVVHGAGIFGQFTAGL
jgi:hypothetical protein